MDAFKQFLEKGGKLTTENVIKLIDMADRVVGCKRDYNSYGEFRFITLEFSGNLYTLWGLGYHEYRDSYKVKFWSYYDSTLDKPQSLDKEGVKEIIRKEYEEYKEYAKEHKQSDRGKLFSIVAALTDEDGAMSFIEDLDDSDIRLLLGG